MTSPAKIRANRRNARRSTGPKSSAGKAIAARNSLRHGLTLPVLDDPSIARDIVELARCIETSVTGREADPAGHALACHIAEAMIDLRRVRDAKLPLTAAVHADPCDFRSLVQLSRLDRYERHALGRRKRAIWNFGAAAVLAASIDKTKPTEKRQ